MRWQFSANLPEDPLEAGVRLVCTRGPEGTDNKPTVFATLIDVTPAQRDARRNGVKLTTASLGMSADVRSSNAPWLLGGAKTLSYAAYMAIIRYAASQGSDDALLISTDGIVLEAPTASVIWVANGALCTTPVDTGILAGTTANYLLEHVTALGLSAERVRITLAELMKSDEAWLCSSVRGAARITHIDGQPMQENGYTSAVQNVLGFPV